MSAFGQKLARHFKAHWFFYLLVVVGIAVDLGSKSLAFSSIEHEIIYVKNPRVIARPISMEYKSGLHPIALAPFSAGLESDSGLDGALKPPRVTVIPKFFNFQLSFNPGAMFGMLPNVTFLIIFTFVAVGVIIYALTRISGNARVYQVGLALIAAGAVANLYDRLVWHAVRDFLDFSVEFWPSFASWLVRVRGNPAGAHWPTFNFADVFIVAGVVMIFMKQILVKKPKENTSA